MTVNFRMLSLLCALLCLCLVLSACDQGPANNTDPSNVPPSSSESTKETSKPNNDGKVTYTVRVVDENGKPVGGGMIQFCLDACMPCVLDANGVGTLRLPEADYKVSFMTLPAGYTLSGTETEFYFADGSYEMTITLKAA